MSEKISYKDFSAKIKSQYPEYADIDDFELSQKIIEKYPVYEEKVSLADNTDFLPGGKMSLLQPAEQKNSNPWFVPESKETTKQTPITESDKLRLGSFPTAPMNLNLQDKPAGQFYNPEDAQASLYNPREREDDLSGLIQEQTANTQPDIQKEFIDATGESLNKRA